MSHETRHPACLTFTFGCATVLVVLSPTLQALGKFTWQLSATPGHYIHYPHVRKKRNPRAEHGILAALKDVETSVLRQVCTGNMSVKTLSSSWGKEASAVAT